MELVCDLYGVPSLVALLSNDVLGQRRMPARLQGLRSRYGSVAAGRYLPRLATPTAATTR